MLLALILRIVLSMVVVDIVEGNTDIAVEYFFDIGGCCVVD